MNYLYFFLLGIALFGLNSCANTGTPTGGLKDEIPPHLLGTLPVDQSINVKGRIVELYFDEWIEVKSLKQNLQITPLSENNYKQRKKSIMIIQLEKNIQAAEYQHLTQKLASINYQYTKVKTQFQEYLVAIGKQEFDIRSIGVLDGVQDLHRVSDNYKLVSSKWKVQDTIIDLGDGVKIGGGHFSAMAGPCSIEGEEQIEETVKHLVKNNVRIMRGGVYKPRSSPYSFRGMGLDGLKLFYKACQAEGIKIITEVMQVSQIEGMLDYVDILQVGARNAQNFNLLDALGKIDKPVMLKRGISGTIDELLQAAEYVFSNGNEKILLCERGIRSFETSYRNTLDLNAVPILKDKSHLPVIVDPSHGIGVRKYVEQMSLAGIMAGADGLIVEVHSQPEKAFSDGQQTLSFAEAEVLYKKIEQTIRLRDSF